MAELRLTEWAHMLGFRSHFSAKSSRYSPFSAHSGKRASPTTGTNTTSPPGACR